MEVVFVVRSLRNTQIHGVTKCSGFQCWTFLYG